MRLAAIAAALILALIVSSATASTTVSVVYFYPSDDCGTCQQTFEIGDERIIRVATTLKGGMLAAQLCKTCNDAEVETYGKSGFVTMTVNGHEMMINEGLYAVLQEAEKT